MADDTLTVTVQKNPFMDGGPFTVILDWMSDDAGAVSLAIASTYAAQLPFGPFGPKPGKVQGVLRSIETIPGLSGDLTTTLPTDQYDITILDKYGLDVLAGVGMNRDDGIAEKVVAGAGKIIVDSELTLTIAAAGDNTTGRVILEFEPLEGC
jgi:hypothetical protein